MTLVFAVNVGNTMENCSMEASRQPPNLLKMLKAAYSPTSTGRNHAVRDSVAQST